MSPSPIVAALIPSNTCLAVVINEIDVECVALFADRGSGPCQIRTGPGCPSQRGTVQVLILQRRLMVRVAVVDLGVGSGRFGPGVVASVASSTS